MKSLLAVLLFVTPILARAQAQDQSAAALAAAGCGPRQVEFEVKTDKNRHPIAEPDAGKALVYVIGDVEVYRPTTRAGVDGAWVGANHGESYFFFPVSPGEHRLCIEWQSSRVWLSKLGSALTFNAETGKTYYFRIAGDEKKKREVGLALEQIDPAKAQFLISSSALSTSHPRK